MEPHEAAAGLAAFREAVHEEFQLADWLRRARPRDAYAALVVTAGAECGFSFDAATVLAAMREGEDRWLMVGADVA